MSTLAVLSTAELSNLTTSLAQNPVTPWWALPVAPPHLQGCTILHRAAEYGAIKACNLIVQLRPDAIYDCDKKVGITVGVATSDGCNSGCGY